VPIDAPIEKDGVARLAINLRGDIAGLPSTVAGGYEIGSVDLTRFIHEGGWVSGFRVGSPGVAGCG